MPRVQKMISIYFCFEKKCGGETIATESLIHALKNQAYTTSDQLSPPFNSSFLTFWLWQWGSVLRWLVKIFVHQRSDWIYTTTYPALFAATILKLIKGYHICFHYHGNRLPDKYPFSIFSFHKWLRYHSAHMPHSIGLKKCDLIIVPSLSSKIHLLNQFPIASQKNLKIIPNGVVMQNNQKPAKKASPPFHLLSVGRPHPLKQLFKLVDMVHGLNSNGNKIKLTFALLPPQNIEESDYFTQLSSKVSNDSNIRLIVNPSNLHSLYRQSNFTISLSQIENFSLTMLESIAAGTPFASTTTGETAQFLSQIDPRLVLKKSHLDYQILSLLLLPTQDLAHISRRGLDIVRHYSWSNISSQIMSNLLSYAA